MDTEQMERRIHECEFVESGVLKDYKLVFNRKGSYRTGGVASVEPEQGNEVYGVIWSFDKNLLLKLDELEDPEAYQRSVLRVSGISGKKYDCFIYTAFAQGNLSADPEYLELIISAAKKLNLPSSYIHFLKGFRMHMS